MPKKVELTFEAQDALETLCADFTQFWGNEGVEQLCRMAGVCPAFVELTPYTLRIILNCFFKKANPSE